MHQAHVQQVECLITLADELHFGRTATRLGYSPSRVSQLIATLESGVGARLVDRTSRRVSLTRVGAQFVKEITPAYRALLRTFARARDQATRGALEELRIGFTGMIHEQVTRTFRTLDDQYGVTVHAHDLPLGSPFGAVLEGEVDAVIVELPVHEPELTIGFCFPAQDQYIALGRDHPLATRVNLDVEELAELDLLHRRGSAPDYWMATRTPRVTPAGTPILSTASISTIEQGMALVASGRHAMLVCRPLTEHHARSDLCFLPVRGLEKTSNLGLVWRTGSTSPQLTTLARLLEAEGEPVVPLPSATR